MAAPHCCSWDKSSGLLISPCSVQTSAPPYPAFLSAVWLWVQLSWPQTWLWIYSCSLFCVHSWKGSTETSTGTPGSCWLWKKVVCICLLVFFIFAAKVVLARLRWVWSGLPEDPWCKTRRSKALEKNVFAVLFTGVRKAFVKMPLCWLQSDSLECKNYLWPSKLRAA